LIIYLQTNISLVLGIPRNKIAVSVKRVGGAFGGKETAPNLCCCATAIAAMR